MFVKILFSHMFEKIKKSIVIYAKCRHVSKTFQLQRVDKDQFQLQYKSWSATK